MNPLAAVNLETTIAQQYEFIMEMLTCAKYSHPPTIYFCSKALFEVGLKIHTFCQQAGVGQSGFVVHYALWESRQHNEDRDFSLSFLPTQ